MLHWAAWLGYNVGDMLLNILLLNIQAHKHDEVAFSIGKNFTSSLRFYKRQIIASNEVMK